MSPVLPRLTSYATIIFDCDGVLLDSNRVKTEAFRTVALDFGDRAADALIAHHRQYGGISRHQKFKHFIEKILRLPADQAIVDSLVACYAAQVRAQLLHCPVAEGLAELRQQTRHARWAVVSGGAQDELRDVFVRRGLDDLFDAGIYGSPDSKDIIFSRLIKEGVIQAPAIYLGDSQYDHEAATRANIQFIFVHQWSEFQAWLDYCSWKGVVSIRDIAELLQ